MEISSRPEVLRPGDLLPALRERTRNAIACGALHSIETEQQIIEDSGVRFLVRSVSSLRRKRERPSAGPLHPFLPPEPELTVGALTPTHTAVLNKFNVLKQHLLIVTRRFEHQESLLTRNDFEALWLSLREIDGLGFYNGGREAGASQNHKHLQLVPIPLTTLLLMGIMIGVFLVPVGLLFQDFSYGLAVFGTGLMFFTPVGFPPPQKGLLALIVNHNPLTPLIMSAREFIVMGTSNYIPSMLLIMLFTFILIFIGWVFFRLAMPIVIERIGS